MPQSPLRLSRLDPWILCECAPLRRRRRRVCLFRRRRLLSLSGIAGRHGRALCCKTACESCFCSSVALPESLERRILAPVRRGHQRRTLDERYCGIGDETGVCGRHCSRSGCCLGYAAAAACSSCSRSWKPCGSGFVSRLLAWMPSRRASKSRRLPTIKQNLIRSSVRGSL